MKNHIFGIILIMTALNCNNAFSEEINLEKQHNTTTKSPEVDIQSPKVVQLSETAQSPKAAAQLPETAQSPKTVQRPEGAMQSPEEVLSLKKNDRYIGNKFAPVKIVEYASFTCIHCADFENSIFSELKSKYIDTGKVLFVFRSFPLRYQDLKSTMVAECYDDNEMFFKFKSALFGASEGWSNDQKNLDNLRSITRLSGMGDEKFEQCSNSEEAQQRAIENKFAAYTVLNVTATPTIFIDNSKFDQPISKENLFTALDSILAKKTNFTASESQTHMKGEISNQNTN